MNIENLTLVIPILLSLAGVAAAGGPLGLIGGSKGHSGDLVHCDKSCDHCLCFPTIEEVTVKKPCFEVECEQICVPKVRLPWPLFGGLSGKGKGCDHLRGCSGTQCGHVKTIRILKVESYECTECKCNWDISGKGCGKSKGYLRSAPEGPPDVHEEAPRNDVPPPPPVQATRRPVHTAHRSPAMIQVRRVSSPSYNNIMGR